MIGCERGVLKSLSRSQERVGRGSPRCETHDCIKDILTTISGSSNCINEGNLE